MTNKTYWMGVDSDVLQVDNSDKVSLKSQSPSRLTTLYGECATSKLCLGLPYGCLINENCVMVFATTYSNATIEAEMEIAGVMSATDRYFAAGLSETQTMGGTSVTECTLLRNNQAIVRTSWNHRRENYDDQVLQVRVLDAVFEDGLVYCRFSRPAEFIHRGVQFDIRKQNYHLMVAKGDLSPWNGKLTVQYIGICPFIGSILQTLNGTITNIPIQTNH